MNNTETQIERQKMIVNEIIIEGKKYHDVLIFTEVETVLASSSRPKTRLIIEKLKGYGDYK